MRHLAAGAAALGLFALALAPVAAQEGGTARLLTPDELSAPAPGPGPVILRGSAVGPKRAASAAGATAPRLQIAGGRRLWIVDPVTQEFRVCGLFQTPDVGVRQVRCWTRPVGRYARTFGPAFQP